MYPSMVLGRQREKFEADTTNTHDKRSRESFDMSFARRNVSGFRGNVARTHDDSRDIVRIPWDARYLCQAGSPCVLRKVGENRYYIVICIHKMYIIDVIQYIRLYDIEYKW